MNESWVLEKRTDTIFGSIVKANDGKTYLYIKNTTCVPLSNGWGVRPVEIEDDEWLVLQLGNGDTTSIIEIIQKTLGLRK